MRARTLMTFALRTRPLFCSAIARRGLVFVQRAELLLRVGGVALLFWWLLLLLLFWLLLLLLLLLLAGACL